MQYVKNGNAECGLLPHISKYLVWWITFRMCICTVYTVSSVTILNYAYKIALLSDFKSLANKKTNFYLHYHFLMDEERCPFFSLSKTFTNILVFSSAFNPLILVYTLYCLRYLYVYYIFIAVLARAWIRGD